MKQPFYRLTPVVAVLLATACGPNFTIEPLTGEDGAILAMMGSTATDLAVPPTVVTAERFYRSLWSKRASNIWSFLSRDTRAALDKLATRLDTNGRTLLQSQTFPKPGGDKTHTLKVSLSALFLVRRPITFEQVTKPSKSATRAQVLVINRQGIRRKVELRRERGEWRIHHPDFTELPPAVDLQPKLLPQDKVSSDTPVESPGRAPDVESEEKPEDKPTTEPKAPPARQSGEAPPAKGDSKNQRKKPDLDF